jgi:glycoprotein endo-alpha-1,2-mannosidase
MKHAILILFSILLTCRSVYSQVKVAAYYYPWHTKNFHNNQGYLRRYLQQGPLLGEYNDRNREVINQHLTWSAHANINVWITSWFGPNSQTDETLLSSILPTISSSTLQFALFYETVNRVGVTIPTTKRIVDDIIYICENYLTHTNYYRIQNKPVLFIYITRVLQQLGTLAEVLLLMRSTASKRGFDLYIVADHAFGMPPTGFEDYFNYFDAITNYDVYGSLGRFHVGPQKLQKFYKDQAQWKAQAAMQDCHFMPSVTPGFNDRGVRLEVNHQPLSRKLTNTSGFGSLFQASIEYAMELVDTDADNLIVITSFNEWHEDTQIEPAIGRLTNVPYNYTMGLEYEGYGTLYIDILREMTTGASFNSSITSPISPTVISNPFAPHNSLPQPNQTSLQTRAP